MSRGKELEAAIARAARDYRKEGRAVLMRQQPMTAPGKNGEAIFVSDAPVDFIGAKNGGRAIAFEAKETGEHSFPLAKLRHDQREALAALAAVGVECAVVIDFKRLAEVYAVDWARIAEFIAAPWRKSLTVDWCRAYGVHVPEQNRDSSSHPRKTLVLDGGVHPEAIEIHDRILAEQRSSPVISLEDEEDLQLDVPMPPREQLTPEQWKERIIKAANDGIDRQLNQRRRKWAPGRGR